MSIDRYPGPRSFESNEQAIFRGRTSEIKDLLDLIRLEQVIVLFSKSGLGKSSLLNAGVGPALPAFDYQPIRVRFQIFSAQSTTEAIYTTPLNSAIEYITSEYSAAYTLLQKELDKWQLEMAQLPNGNGEQQAELERVIQQQLESLSAEHPLTDEQLAEFKQKQNEITDQPPTETNRRVKLNTAIETGRAALSLTTLLLTEDKEPKYTPRLTTDPFGKPAAGRLWETLKLYPFPNGATPVFFFDQFEEFFAAPPDAQRDFLTQLAEVLGDQPPRRISERIAHELSSADPGQHASPSQRVDVDKDRIAELAAWGRQPAVKCVFAIRDDRIAEIDSLERFIPLVLKNRYKLNPLNGKNARLAIVEPAAAIGDFTTPRFSYADQNAPDDNSANTLQLIIEGLSNNKDEIDSTQLQMVCNNIETAVEKARKETPEKVDIPSANGEPSLRVDKRLIQNAQTIKTFINEYYKTRLNTVGTPTDVDLAGSVLEKYFVLNGKRIGIDEPLLKEYLGEDGIVIGKLIESRLIRPEPTSRGTAYELSHDKLVEPVELARKAREAEQERQRVLVEEKSKRQIALAKAEQLRQQEQEEARLERERLLAQQEHERKLARQQRELEHIEQQKRLEVERLEQKLLQEQLEAEQYRFSQEVKSRQRWVWIALTLGAFFIGLFVVSSLLVVENGKNTQLRNGLLNEIADRLFETGKHYLAYRIWTDELNDSEKTDSTKKLSQKRFFAPFFGETITAAKGQGYVAVRYKDDSVIVFGRDKDSVYHRILLPGIMPKPGSIEIQGHHMMTISENDSLLQVFDLATGRMPFHMNRIGRGNKHTLYGAELSPMGNYIVLPDTTGRFYLLQILADTTAIVFQDIRREKALEDFTREKHMSVLPNETGYYYYHDFNKDGTYSVTVSTFKRNFIFANVIDVSQATEADKLVFLQKKGQTAIPRVFDVSSQKFTELPPVASQFDQISFVNKDLTVLIENKFDYDASDLVNRTILYTTITQEYSGLSSYSYTVVKGFINQINKKWYLFRESNSSYKFFICNFQDKKSVTIPYNSGEGLLGRSIISRSLDYIVLYKSLDNKFEILSLTTGKIALLPIPSLNMDMLNMIINRPPYRLFATPDEAVVKLTVQLEGKVLIKTIADRNGSYINTGNFPEEVYNDASTILPGSSLSGVVTIKLKDGNMALLFLESHKNKFPYLSDKIYPNLTKAEQKWFGVTK